MTSPLYVSKQYGLAPCHNGTDPGINVTIQSCNRYRFPEWLPKYVSFLWCVFTVECIIV